MKVRVIPRAFMASKFSFKNSQDNTITTAMYVAANTDAILADSLLRANT